MSKHPAFQNESTDRKPPIDRRRFIKTATAGAVAAGAATVAVGALPSLVFGEEKIAGGAKKSAESAVKVLYDSLSEKQKKEVCFQWDHIDPKRGLLRTRVENNWKITPRIINSDFYTDDQKSMVRAIFNQLIQSDWRRRFDRQLKDDCGGFGEEQAIAMFGTPGGDKFEFVLTGRHMTLRCDGNTADHVAFGGPIFYGHAADGFNEGPEHKGNVFWPQAVAANHLFEMLDGKQRKLALAPKRPRAEKSVAFQGPGAKFSGIPVAELVGDQKEHLQKVVAKLIEPYRQTDRDEVVACLKAQGGLDACSLAFYQNADIGNDGVWDNWRLEGPSFVWYFRGSPHVHVWVNIADDPSVKLNA